MSRLPLLLAGIFAAFAGSWIGLVAYPFFHLGNLEPEISQDTGEQLPPSMPGTAMAGQRVYAANGCIYCHSQQVRPDPLSTDIEKGLGSRQTVARDYIYATPAFLGTMRTGPDLTNIGVRQPSEEWHYRHLYEPDTVTPGSIMPSFRFLYTVRKIEGQPSMDAVHVTGPNKPAPGFEVVPTQQAKDLAAYLLSLKRNYPLPEAPEVPAK